MRGTGRSRPASRGKIHVGCAAWSIPRRHAGRFPAGGSHLERYARVYPAVEINSSFYRPHRRETYERWAASVPAGFRFAVKLPRQITHHQRLRNASEALAPFLDEAGGLGEKLGPLLVQLPPSLALDVDVLEGFLWTLRERHRGAVALEARHRSWFDPAVDRLLGRHEVSRVAADPSPARAAAKPGGWRKLAYYRLHGSPKLYYSAYAAAFLDALAERVRRQASAAEVWCIFNNTAGGAAVPDALGLLQRLGVAANH